MQKKITFKEIARRAGVSPATVSRIVNRTGNIDPELQKRVMNVATRLGVSLNRKKTRVIGFLLCNRGLLHPFHSRVLLGAESGCAEHDYNILFLPFNYPSNISWRELSLPPILEQGSLVSGVIVAGANYQNLLELLAHRKMPFAILGNNVLGTWKEERADVLYLDDIQGAYELTQYLQTLGHRNIWYLGNRKLPWFARRFEGYRRAMEDAGLKPKVSDLDSAKDEDVGYLTCKSVLTGPDPVTAVFAGGDAMARGACRAIKDNGMLIPRDVSVVGFNDTEAAIIDPPLTSVRVFPEEIGKHLAQLVLNRVSDPDLAPQRFIVPTQLIKRESSRPLSAPTGVVEEDSERTPPVSYSEGTAKESI